MMDEERALFWSTLRGWFTPAVLFLLLNLVIGTIALTSKSLRTHLHRRDSGGLDAPERNPRAQAPPLARGPSAVLERLRSIGLSGFRSGEFHLEQAFPAQEEEAPALSGTGHQGAPEHGQHDQQYYGRSRSDSGEPASEKLAGRMKKSASVSSAFAHFDAADIVRRPARADGRAVLVEEEEQEVDARADDFINRFRQQLKLQRLDSIIRYKDMISRGK